MQLEKAFVRYTKNGDYDYTISSEFLIFNTEEEARNYINKHIERDVEYYFYTEEEDAHYATVICNDILKG